jgi:hypothetical protein
MRSAFLLAWIPLVAAGCVIDTGFQKQLLPETDPSLSVAPGTDGPALTYEIECWRSNEPLTTSTEGESGRRPSRPNSSFRESNTDAALRLGRALRSRGEFGSVEESQTGGAVHVSSVMARSNSASPVLCGLSIATLCLIPSWWTESFRLEADVTLPGGEHRSILLYDEMRIVLSLFLLPVRSGRGMEAEGVRVQENLYRIMAQKVAACLAGNRGEAP